MSARPLCQPFSRLTEAQRASPEASILTMVAEARDVAQGAAEIVSLLERDEIDRECADANGDDLPPLLPGAMRGNLLRLAVTTLSQLADRLDDAFEANADAARPVESKTAVLAWLIPRNPVAGMVLSAEDAAALVALREQLSGAAVSEGR